MRKLILFISVALMFSCAPGKSGEFVRVDMFCDSCKVSIKSWWYKGGDSGGEVMYSGIVNDYQSVNVERYISDIPCVKLSEYVNYSTDTIEVFFISGNDTLSHEIGATGYCN